MEFSLELILLVVSILFFISILAGQAGDKYGIPALLLFLGVGMISGSDGLGIQFENVDIAQTIGTIALCIILFSGGLDTRISEIRPVLLPGTVLATMGVVLTALFTGAIIWFLFILLKPAEGISYLTALLLASAMSSTDSASVFSILRSRNISLKHNLRPMLELESGSNDPVAYLLTITLIDLIKSDQTAGFWIIAGSLILQLIIGAGAGYLLGRLGARIINRLKITNTSLYQILLLSFCLFIFSATHLLNGNSFLAVYIGGMTLGNARLVHKRSSIRFFDGLAWLSQLIMFLTLGLLVNPRELIPIIVPGLLISFIMIFITRPLSVFLSLLPFRKISVAAKIFISWVGLRGAVPVIFSIMALAAEVPHARIIFNIVFFCTLVSLIVQGTYLSKIAVWLGLVDEHQQKDNKDFDIELPEDIGSVTAEITLDETILPKEKKLMDLPFPEKSLVVLVRRGDGYYIPTGQTLMKSGDKLLIISENEETLKQTYQRLGLQQP